MLENLLLKKGNMVFTASGALRPLKNANLKLDVILIREMIQNSLDASNSVEVQIDIVMHKFNNEQLKGFIKRNLIENKVKKFILELIQLKLATNILELSDFGTTGLTGKIYTKENSYGINNEKRNNFFNLIFDITRSQTAEFSGGSYGLGKTIYFLCSEIGLVIYYTNCLNDNNKLDQ